MLRLWPIWASQRELRTGSMAGGDLNNEQLMELVIQRMNNADQKDEFEAMLGKSGRHSHSQLGQCFSSGNALLFVVLRFTRSDSEASLYEAAPGADFYLRRNRAVETET